MNVFDVGGIVSTIALVFTLLIGTGIFIGINTIFECWYFGWGALIGEWLIVAAFIVNFLSGIVGGLFSVLWFLIKLVVVIGVLGSIVIFIYSKVKGKNNTLGGEEKVNNEE